MNGIIILITLIAIHFQNAIGGCCSLKYKDCDATWCGDTEEECLSCGNSGTYWLENGALDSTCSARWEGCSNNACCPGLTCTSSGGSMQCLVDSVAPNAPTVAPTPKPTSSPTKRPTSTPTKRPTSAPVSSPTVKPTSSPVASPTPAPVAPTAPTSSEASEGTATYYGGNVAGNACGFIDLPTATFPYGYSAAGGGDVFDDGYGCGSCYQITCTGPNGYNPSCYCDGTTPTVTVQVTDQCPECDDSHFDLNTEAFTYIVGDGLAGTCGIIDTLWERVNCPFETNIRIRSKSGTSQWWYGLHVDYVAGYGDLSSVSLRRGGTTDFDVSCDKSGGSTFWLCNFSASDPLVLPVDVQLTDSAGRTLYGYGVITSFDGGAEFDFGSNFEDI